MMVIKRERGGSIHSMDSKPSVVCTIWKPWEWAGVPLTLYLLSFSLLSTKFLCCSLKAPCRTSQRDICLLQWVSINNYYTIYLKIQNQTHCCLDTVNVISLPIRDKISSFILEIWVNSFSENMCTKIHINDYEHKGHAIPFKKSKVFRLTWNK